MTEITLITHNINDIITTGALLVVAAAIIDARGQVLVQRRPAGLDHAGLWEFPGGKCLAGEPPRTALARELTEELGITIDPAGADPLSFYCGPRAAASDGDDLLMLLFMVRQWHGVPAPNDGQTVDWVNAEQLSRLAMPPADVPLRLILRPYLGAAGRLGTA